MVLVLSNGILVNNSRKVPLGVELVISNSQSSATPAPFQQAIAISTTSLSVSIPVINNSTLFNMIASNGQNVLFNDAYGNLLYSWYEGPQVISGSTVYIWWVKIPNGINANSSLTIYMNIANSSINFYTTYPGYVGANPTINNGTYGSWDNGNNVFNYYWNFAGTSLPSGWSCTVLSNPSGASGTCSVNNGLSISNTNGADLWDNDYMITLAYYNNAINTTGLIWEAKLTSLTGNSGDGGWTKFGILIQNSINDNSTSNGEVDMVVTSGNGYAFQWQSGTSYIAPSGNSNGGSISYPTYVALAVQSTSSVGGFYGPSLGVLSQMGSYEAPTSMSSTGYVGIFITSHNSSNYTSTGTSSYFLARAYPPNGVMPSVNITQIINDITPTIFTI